MQFTVLPTDGKSGAARQLILVAHALQVQQTYVLSKFNKTITFSLPIVEQELLQTHAESLVLFEQRQMDQIT